MTQEEMLEACRGGILLPPVEGGAAVTFRPESVEWDAGILARKGSKALFVCVEDAMEDEAWISSMTESFRDVGMPCILVAARTPAELSATGSRAWVYNPRIHGTAPPEGTEGPPDQKVHPQEPPAAQAKVPEPETSQPVPVQERPAAEHARTQTEQLTAPAAWARLGKEAADWNAAEQGRARLLEDEDLEQVAGRLLGTEAGHAWMERPLMLLGGRSPRQAASGEDGLARCLSILRKVSLVHA